MLPKKYTSMMFSLFILFWTVTASSSQLIDADYVYEYITMKPPAVVNQVNTKAVNRTVTPVLQNKKCNNQNIMERSTVYIQHDKYKTPKWYDMNPDKNGITYSNTNINVNELADHLDTAVYLQPHQNRNYKLQSLQNPGGSRTKIGAKLNISQLFAPAPTSGKINKNFANSLFIPTQHLIHKNHNELKMTAPFHPEFKILQMLKPPSSRPYDGKYERLFQDILQRYYALNERATAKKYVITSRPSAYFSYQDSHVDNKLRNKPAEYSTALPTLSNNYDYEFSFAKDFPYGVRKYNTPIMSSSKDNGPRPNQVLKVSRTRCQCLRKRSDHRHGPGCEHPNPNKSCGSCKSSKHVPTVIVTPTNKKDESFNEDRYDSNMTRLLKDVQWIINKVT